MSLLMEALKKAEQAKQAAQDGLRLEPIDSSAAAAGPDKLPNAPKNLPDLPPKLDVLDAEFVTPAGAGKAAAAVQPGALAGGTPAANPKHAPQLRPGRQASAATPAHAAVPPAEAERRAAQQVFSAKQPPARTRVGFVVAMGLVFLVCASGIGGYVWWELQPKPGLAAAGLARVSPRAPLASLAPPVPLAQPAQNTQAVAVASAPPAPLEPARATAVAAAALAEEDVPRPRAAKAATAESASPIRITKSQLRVNPGASRGFEALIAGDLETAKNEYRRLLEAEPRNGDALRGLAAVALRQGDASTAGEWYLKALEANPKDAVSQAGLIGLRGAGGEAGDPPALESRLKTLIAAQPEVAALHFALGNVYARQSRWNDAQQAFFKAFSVDPEHPDYVFNLAVSLDHLRQSRLAAQYYQQALTLATQRAAGFDKAQVAARLRDLPH